MRFTPPPIEIPADDPFKNDLLARKGFADALTSLVKAADENLVVLVNARWGEGKTVFAQMWHADLKRQGCDAIYFDAFKNDYAEDAFVSICAAIHDFAKEKVPGAETGQTSKFGTVAAKAAKRLAGVGVKVAVSALTAGLVRGEHVDEVKKAVCETASGGIGDVVEAAIEEHIEEHAEAEREIEAFRERLKNLGAAARATMNGFPLVIMVDELDRCRPSFALQLLERVKHLFDVPNVVFVLFANLEQLERHVVHAYGADQEERRYLSKFVHLVTELPAKRAGDVIDGYDKIAFKCLNHHGIDRVFADGPNKYLIFWARRLSLSLRELERVCASLAVCAASSSPPSLSSAHELAMLAVLRVKEPAVFNRISKEQIEFRELVRVLGMPESGPSDSAENQEKYSYAFLYNCLSPVGLEAEAQGVRSLIEGMKKRYRYDPDLLRSLCLRLSVFEPLAPELVLPEGWRRVGDR